MPTGRLTSMKSVNRAPSFRGLKPASETASRSKSANQKTDSIHEILLRRELTRLGLRYRKYVTDLPGSPDILFHKAKVAVFCDGDFWPCRDWVRLKRKLLRRHNANYWIAKIARNRERDREVSRMLAKAGWTGSAMGSAWCWHRRRGMPRRMPAPSARNSSVRRR